jgi:hypothetical protein
MYCYIGITVNLTVFPVDSLRGTGLEFEMIKPGIGIIYVRKGNTAEQLLIGAQDLECIKGHIRRLPIDIYDQLNDDFGYHEIRQRPSIKLR